MSENMKPETSVDKHNNLKNNEGNGNHSIYWKAFMPTHGRNCYNYYVMLCKGDTSGSGKRGLGN